MKKLITACMGVLLISGCALSKPGADEVAAAYQTNINSTEKELIREQVVEKCSLVSYKEGKLKISCRLTGDVLIYDIRLTDNRWQWNPQAAAIVTKEFLTNFCNDTDNNPPLQSGFALLINLQGKNGFVGKIKTIEDCKSLELAQNK
ncbi:hypothetical protein [Psychromonas aquimarina]|uniref:hypothetical protein n=1 Tax=Psychromonas aquimarina TaxID=444919 RepID=UPI00041F1BFA|nr:hypothetical protein [Psychromonas aquimarina]